MREVRSVTERGQAAQHKEGGLAPRQRGNVQRRWGRAVPQLFSTCMTCSFARRTNHDQVAGFRVAVDLTDRLVATAVLTDAVRQLG